MQEGSDCGQSRAFESGARHQPATLTTAAALDSIQDLAAEEDNNDRSDRRQQCASEPGPSGHVRKRHKTSEGGPQADATNALYRGRDDSTSIEALAVNHALSPTTQHGPSALDPNPAPTGVPLSSTPPLLPAAVPARPFPPIMPPMLLPAMPSTFIPAMCQLLLVYIQRATAQQQQQPPAQPSSHQPAGHQNAQQQNEPPEDPGTSQAQDPKAHEQNPQAERSQPQAPQQQPQQDPTAKDAGKEASPQQTATALEPPVVSAVRQLQTFGLPLALLLQAAAHLMVVGAITPVHYQLLQAEMGPAVATPTALAAAASAAAAAGPSSPSLVPHLLMPSAAAPPTGAPTAAPISAQPPPPDSAQPNAAGPPPSSPEGAAVDAALQGAITPHSFEAAGAATTETGAAVTTIGTGAAATGTAEAPAAAAAAAGSGQADANGATEAALWMGRGVGPSLQRLGLGRRLFNAIADQLPTNAHLDSLLPPVSGISGVLYKLQDSTEVGCALWDGSTLQNLGTFSTTQDARQNLNVSIRWVAAATASALEMAATAAAVGAVTAAVTAAPAPPVPAAGGGRRTSPRSNRGGSRLAGAAGTTPGKTKPPVTTTITTGAQTGVVGAAPAAEMAEAQGRRPTPAKEASAAAAGVTADAAAGGEAAAAIEADVVDAAQQLLRLRRESPKAMEPSADGAALGSGSVPQPLPAPPPAAAGGAATPGAMVVVTDMGDARAAVAAAAPAAPVPQSAAGRPAQLALDVSQYVQYPQVTTQQGVRFMRRQPAQVLMHPSQLEGGVLVAVTSPSQQQQQQQQRLIAGGPQQAARVLLSRMSAGEQLSAGEQVHPRYVRLQHTTPAAPQQQQQLIQHASNSSLQQQMQMALAHNQRLSDAEPMRIEPPLPGHVQHPPPPPSQQHPQSHPHLNPRLPSQVVILTRESAQAAQAPQEAPASAPQNHRASSGTHQEAAGGGLPITGASAHIQAHAAAAATAVIAAGGGGGGVGSSKEALGPAWHIHSHSPAEAAANANAAGGGGGGVGPPLPSGVRVSIPADNQNGSAAVVAMSNPGRPGPGPWVPAGTIMSGRPVLSRQGAAGSLDQSPGVVVVGLNGEVSVGAVERVERSRLAQVSDLGTASPSVRNGLQGDAAEAVAAAVAARSAAGLGVQGRGSGGYAAVGRGGLVGAGSTDTIILEATGSAGGGGGAVGGGAGGGNTTIVDLTGNDNQLRHIFDLLQNAQLQSQQREAVVKALLDYICAGGDAAVGTSTGSGAGLQSLPGRPSSASLPRGPRNASSLAAGADVDNHVPVMSEAKDTDGFTWHESLKTGDTSIIPALSVPPSAQQPQPQQQFQQRVWVGERINNVRRQVHHHQLSARDMESMMECDVAEGCNKNLTTTLQAMMLTRSNSSRTEELQHHLSMNNNSSQHSDGPSSQQQLQQHQQQQQLQQQQQQQQLQQQQQVIIQRRGAQYSARPQQQQQQQQSVSGAAAGGGGGGGGTSGSIGGESASGGSGSIAAATTLHFMEFPVEMAIHEQGAQTAPSSDFSPKQRVVRLSRQTPHMVYEDVTGGAHVLVLGHGPGQRVLHGMTLNAATGGLVPSQLTVSSEQQQVLLSTRGAGGAPQHIVRGGGRGGLEELGGAGGGEGEVVRVVNSLNGTPGVQDEGMRARNNAVSEAALTSALVANGGGGGGGEIPAGTVFPYVGYGQRAVVQGRADTSPLSGVNMLQLDGRGAASGPSRYGNSAGTVATVSGPAGTPMRFHQFAHLSQHQAAASGSVGSGVSFKMRRSDTSRSSQPQMPLSGNVSGYGVAVGGGGVCTGRVSYSAEPQHHTYYRGRSSGAGDGTSGADYYTHAPGGTGATDSNALISSVLCSSLTTHPAPYSGGGGGMSEVLSRVHPALTAEATVEERGVRSGAFMPRQDGLPPASGGVGSGGSDISGGSGALRLNGEGEVDAQQPFKKRRHSVTREYQAVTDLMGYDLKEALEMVRQRQVQGFQ